MALAAVTSGITWRTRGGAPPRLVETPAGAVYVPGTAAPGVDRRRAPLRTPAGPPAPAPVIVNLRGARAGELPLAAAELQGLPAWPPSSSTSPPRTSAAPPRPAARQILLARCAWPATCPCWSSSRPTSRPGRQTLRAAAVRRGRGSDARRGAAGPGRGGPRAGPRAGWPGTVTHGAGPQAGSSPAGSPGRRPATFPVVLALIARLARDAPLPLIACGGAERRANARRGPTSPPGAAAVQVGSAHLAQPAPARGDLRRGPGP